MRKISCLEAVRKIFELIEGRILPSGKKQLAQHVTTCRECCDRLEFEKLLKEKLYDSNRNKEIPVSFTKRVDDLLRNF